MASSGLTFERLTPADWVSAPVIVASGMLVFISYEGFELIANVSDRVRNPNKNLRYAVRRSGVWNIETVDQDALHFSPLKLQLDADDNPHIAYLTGEYGDEFANLNLIYATLKLDSNWEFTPCIENSTTIETRQSLDLVLDPDLNAHIVLTYTGESGRGLYHILAPASITVLTP